jgi:hypothetical protein
MNTHLLFLKPEQVPFGMLVHVCAPGTNTPGTDRDGKVLPPLMPLLGGVPIRTKWYIFDQAKELYDYQCIRA